MGRKMQFPHDIEDIETTNNLEELSDTDNPKIDKYYIVFHGETPSILAAGLFYRFVGNRDPRGHINRKTIKCPYCSKDLTEVDKYTKVELFRHPSRSKIRCQAYPKCPNCKVEVGIIIV